MIHRTGTEKKKYAFIECVISFPLSHPPQQQQQQQQQPKTRPCVVLCFFLLVVIDDIHDRLQDRCQFTFGPLKERRIF
jgi:hypothetical protein